MKGQTAHIKVDPSLSRTGITLEAMIKTLRKERGGILVELNQIDEVVRKESEEAPEFLRAAIDDFSEVFKSPKGLPPSRGREHAIVLKRVATW